MTTKTTTKVVSFVDVSVYDTLHLDDYSDAEVEASWYTDDEMSMIKADITEIVMRMESLSRVNNNTDDDFSMACTRGLENVCTRKIVRRKAIHAVLQEQAFQKQCSCDANNIVVNSNRIADLYSKRSQKSMELAQIMGHADQEWVTMTLAQEEVQQQRRRGHSFEKLEAAKNKAATSWYCSLRDKSSRICSMRMTSYFSKYNTIRKSPSIFISS